MCLNASLAGLVGITAGCYRVDAIGATVIGAVSGILVVVVAELLDKKLHIDDPVGAVAVHCANGIWGTIAVGFFACVDFQSGATGVDSAGNIIDKSMLGLFYGGNGYLLGIQIAGILAIICWTAVWMALIFAGIKYIPIMVREKCGLFKAVKIGKVKNGLRASADDEVAGLDISEHGLDSAYADFLPTAPSYDGEGANVDLSGVMPADIDLTAGTTEPRYSKVTIITGQEKFLTLKDAMAQIGVTGMTVSTVMGCGAQSGKTGQYRGVKTSMHLLPKVQVEVVVSEVDPKLVVAVAQKVLADGKYGAGKIFVNKVENVMRVRTGETGKEALSNVMDEE